MTIPTINPKPFHRIDLANVPVAAVLQQSSYEEILAELKANFLSYVPEDERSYFAAALELETEPLLIQLQAAAYRELHKLEQRNLDLKRLLLSEASGTDLDALAANVPWGIERLHGEDDARFLTRILLSNASASSAGSRDDYRFYALSADVNLFDAEVYSPVPGEVELYLLAKDGPAPQDSVDKVRAVVTSEDVCPFDDVTVAAATMINFSVDARLYLYEGPDAETVLNYARTQLDALLKALFLFGYDVDKSAIYAGLRVGGVQRVELIGWEDVIVEPYQAAYCTAKNVQVAGRDE